MTAAMTTSTWMAPSGPTPLSSSSSASSSSSSASSSPATPTTLDDEFNFYHVFGDLLTDDPHARADATHDVISRLLATLHVSTDGRARTDADHSNGNNNSNDGNDGNHPVSHARRLLCTHVPTAVRLALECPFADVRAAFQSFLRHIADVDATFHHLRPRILGPSAFVPHSTCIPLCPELATVVNSTVVDGIDAAAAAGAAAAPAANGNHKASSSNGHDADNNPSDDNPTQTTVQPLFEQLFLATGRVSHVDQLMGWHPSYLELFSQSLQFIMDDDGPLPQTWRHYIAILAATRHRCEYLVRQQEWEFLSKGGPRDWLMHPSHVPAKLTALHELNALLCHQPWLVGEREIHRLVGTVGDVSWSVAELVHAITIMSTFHALCIFVFGMGVTPEVDMTDLQTFQQQQSHTSSSSSSSSPPPQQQQHTANGSTANGEAVDALAHAADRMTVSAASTAAPSSNGPPAVKRVLTPKDERSFFEGDQLVRLLTTNADRMLDLDVDNDAASPSSSSSSSDPSTPRSNASASTATTSAPIHTAAPLPAVHTVGVPLPIVRASSSNPFASVESDDVRWGVAHAPSHAAANASAHPAAPGTHSPPHAAAAAALAHHHHHTTTTMTTPSRTIGTLGVAMAMNLYDHSSSLPATQSTTPPSAHAHALATTTSSPPHHSHHDNSHANSTSSSASTTTPPPSSSSTTTTAWMSRFADVRAETKWVNAFKYTQFDVNSKTYSTFFLHDYNWKEHGYALVNRFYQGFAKLIDDEWDLIYSLTYSRVGNSSPNVTIDTTPFRRAIWFYTHRLFGLCHDDYKYEKVNVFVAPALKSVIRKLACSPDTFVAADFAMKGYAFQPDEKAHIVLLVMEAKRQAAMLYALHAVMKHMTAT